jgi:hypothetical protein
MYFGISHENIPSGHQDASLSTLASPNPFSWQASTYDSYKDVNIRNSLLASLNSHSEVGQCHHLAIVSFVLILN